MNNKQNKTFLIGNLHATALLSEQGVVKWLSWSALSNESAILNRTNSSGLLRILIDGYQCFTDYVPDTAVVESFVSKPDHSYKMRAFMVPDTKKKPRAQYLVKKFVGDRGSGEVCLEFNPSSELDKTFKATKRGAIIICSYQQSVVKLWLPNDACVTRNNETWRITFSLDSSEEKQVVLEYSRHGQTDFKRQNLESQTIEYWHKWVLRGQFLNFERELLVRSAITLKLLQQTTGALATSVVTIPRSIHESFGDEEKPYLNLRDLPTAVQAWLDYGYPEEAVQLFEYWEMHELNVWQQKLSLKSRLSIDGKIMKNNSSAASMMQRHDNQSTLEEASFDVYASLLLAYLTLHEAEVLVLTSSKERVVRWVEKLATNWKERDYGCWNLKQGPQHYTYSKLMALVGVRAGIKLGKDLGVSTTRIESWQNLEKEIVRWIMTYCYDTVRKTFVLQPASRAQSAGNFLFIWFNFFEPSDSRIVPMLRATAHEVLHKDGFCFLWRSTAVVKGLEAVDLVASFWYVGSLVETGETKEALQYFNKIKAKINDSGLMPHKIDLNTGEMFGGWPWAASHINFMLVTKKIYKYCVAKYGRIMTEKDFKELK